MRMISTKKTMGEKIFNKNLCGRKVYCKRKNEFIGVVVADYDFENEENKKRFMMQVKGTLLVLDTASKVNFGWPIKGEEEAKILVSKNIKFDANSRGWYVFKNSIIRGAYALDKTKMVIDNE